MAYFPKFKDVTFVTVIASTQETVCNPSAKALRGEPVYKFEGSRFSHSGDILGGT